MSDTDRERAPLVPVIQRAEQAAADEELTDPPVRAGIGRDDSLVLAEGDDEVSQMDRWLASDVVIDIEEWA